MYALVEEMGDIQDTVKKFKPITARQPANDLSENYESIDLVLFKNHPVKKNEKNLPKALEIQEHEKSKVSENISKVTHADSLFSRQQSLLRDAQMA